VALGGCAHLGSLRRLRAGPFGIDETHPIETIATDPPAFVLPLAEAMRGLERVDVDEERARGVRHGMQFPVTAFDAELGTGPFAIVGSSGDLLAVYERSRGGLKPAVVVAADAEPSEPGAAR
jgi:tRNA pseudouridine55 synthase